MRSFENLNTFKQGYQNCILNHKRGLDYNSSHQNHVETLKKIITNIYIRSELTCWLGKYGELCRSRTISPIFNSNKISKFLSSSYQHYQIEYNFKAFWWPWYDDYQVLIKRKHLSKPLHFSSRPDFSILSFSHLLLPSRHIWIGAKVIDFVFLVDFQFSIRMNHLN